jgi:hypothetical protein
MSASLEELSPSYIGETRIVLARTTVQPLAHHPVSVSVDVSAALPEGLVLPLELVVQGPSVSSYQRKTFTRAVPVTLIFVPREGGVHLVRLAEVAHNRWWGSVKITVQGDSLEVS